MTQIRRMSLFAMLLGAASWAGVALIPLSRCGPPQATPTNPTPWSTKTATADTTGSRSESQQPQDPEGARGYYLEQRLAPGMQSYPMAHVSDVQAWLRTVERPQSDEAKNLPRWYSLGPGNIGGRTRALVIDPINPATMLAGGVAGGVWKTTDAGAHWRAVGDHLPNLAISCLAMDPTDPAMVYAGTGEGYLMGYWLAREGLDNVMQEGLGVYRSADGGDTWTHLRSTIEGVPAGAFDWVNDIIVSPSSPNLVYAATRSGVWRSTDAGGSWSVVLANPRYLEAENESNGCLLGCTDLALGSDGSADTVFAAFGSYYSDGLYRSRDGGDTWQRTTPDLPHQGRMSIAVAPSDSRVVYLSMAQNRNGTFGKLGNVFRSVDGGDSWQGRVDLASGLGPWLLSFSAGAIGCMNFPLYHMGEYANVIAVDPIEPDVVWLGSTYLYRSDDGGRTFGYADGPLYGPSAFYQLNHPDNHAIVFHPWFDGTTNQTVFVASDGGIARSDNSRAETSPSFCPLTGALRWSNLNNGYAVTQYYHGAVAATTDLFIGGAHDNGTSMVTSRTAADEWTTVFLGDGGYVAVDPRDPAVLYVEMQGFPTIHKSTDGGASFSPATTGIGDTDALFISPFALDPSDPDVLWTGGRRPFRTSNGGNSWQRVGNELAGAGKISAIGIAPGQGEVVYLGFNNGVIARTLNGRDENPHWRVSEGVNGFISSITVDSGSPDRAFCTVSTFGRPHVLKSDTGGRSWTSIDGTGEHRIPDIPAHWLVQRPCAGNQIFVGTELGIFRSNDRGATWARLGEGMPNTVVETLVFKDSDTLVAFTYGRGVFLLELEPCVPPPRRVSRRM